MRDLQNKKEIQAVLIESLIKKCKEQKREMDTNIELFNQRAL